MNDNDSWEDLLSRAIQIYKQEGYSLPADEVRDEAALGCMIAGHFEHTGENIFITVLHGLEDANFHSFIPLLVEAWNGNESIIKIDQDKALSLRKEN